MSKHRQPSSPTNTQVKQREALTRFLRPVLVKLTVRVRTGGGRDCQVMIEEIKLYESPKFIQPFSNPEKFEIKAKLTEKNERKSIINNLLAAF